MKLEVRKFYTEFLYIVFLFFAMAFFGGLLETCFTYITLGKLSLSGFMYGPWRPIYGWGALLLYFITQKFNKNVFVTFLSCSFICSVFEYLASFFLELIFKKRWWDYTGMFLSINGRICFIHAIMWGILGLLFIKIVEPFIRGKFNKVNICKMTLYLLIIFVLYKVDGFYSWIGNLN